MWANNFSWPATRSVTDAKGGAAVGIDPEDISGYPLAGMPVRRRQHGDSEVTPADGVMIPAVQEHGGPVGEDHEHRLRDTGVDEMNLEMTLLPAFPDFSGGRVGGSGGEGALPIKKHRPGGQRRCFYEISSVHILNDL